MLIQSGKDRDLFTAEAHMVSRKCKDLPMRLRCIPYDVCRNPPAHAEAVRFHPIPTTCIQHTRRMLCIIFTTPGHISVYLSFCPVNGFFRPLHWPTRLETARLFFLSLSVPSLMDRTEVSIERQLNLGPVSGCAVQMNDFIVGFACSKAYKLDRHICEFPTALFWCIVNETIDVDSA